MANGARRFNFIMQELHADPMNAEITHKRLIIVHSMQAMVETALKNHHESQEEKEILSKLVDLTVELLERLSGRSHENAPTTNPKEMARELNHLDKMFKKEDVMNIHEKIKELGSEKRGFCEGILAFAEENKKAFEDGGRPEAIQVFKTTFNRRGLDAEKILEGDYEFKNEDEKNFTLGVMTSAENLLEWTETGEEAKMMSTIAPYDFSEKFLEGVKSAILEIIEEENSNE